MPKTKNKTEMRFNRFERLRMWLSNNFAFGIYSICLINRKLGDENAKRR